MRAPWSSATPLGRDIEHDDLREMFDRGLIIDAAIAEVISGESDRAYEQAVDRAMRG
jgi:hypothetical protein